MTTTIKSSADGTYGALQVNGEDKLRFGSDNSGALQGFRNRIINGDMRIAQRGTVSVPLGVWTYGGCDRTAVALTGFTTASSTLLQVTNPAYASGVCQGGALTSTGVGAVNFEQRIEAANVVDLNSKTVTISAKVFHATGASLSTTLSLVKANTKDVFAAKTTLAVSSVTSVPSATYTVLTLTYTLGSSDATNGLAAQVNFTGVGAVTNKDFFVGDLQLEEGSIATPFEQRPYGLELALCQRYYCAIPIQGVAYSTTGFMAGTSWPVMMRTTPTASIIGSGLLRKTSDGATTYISSSPAYGVNPYGVSYVAAISWSVALVTGQAYDCWSQTTLLSASAEL